MLPPIGLDQVLPPIGPIVVPSTTSANTLPPIMPTLSQSGRVYSSKSSCSDNGDSSIEYVSQMTPNAARMFSEASSYAGAPFENAMSAPGGITKICQLEPNNSFPGYTPFLVERSVDRLDIQVTHHGQSEPAMCPLSPEDPNKLHSFSRSPSARSETPDSHSVEDSGEEEQNFPSLNSLKSLPSTRSRDWSTPRTRAMLSRTRSTPRRKSADYKRYRCVEVLGNLEREFGHRFSTSGMRGPTVLRVKVKTNASLDSILPFLQRLDDLGLISDISCPTSKKKSKTHIRGFLAYMNAVSLSAADRVQEEFAKFNQEHLNSEGRGPFKCIELNPRSRAEREREAAEEQRNLSMATQI